MSERRWSKWARRTWSTPPNPDLIPSVQPVVIVDDVRNLRLSPMRTRYGISDIALGVAAEFGMILLTPGTNRVLRILRIRVTVTGSSVCAVRRVKPPEGTDPSVGFTAAWTWPGTNYLQRGSALQSAVVQGGTNPNDATDGDAAMKLLTAVDYDFSAMGGFIVRPDELFYVQSVNQNVAMTCDHLIWEDVDVDWQEEALFAVGERGTV